MKNENTEGRLLLIANKLRLKNQDGAITQLNFLVLDIMMILLFGLNLKELISIDPEFLFLGNGVALSIFYYFWYKKREQNKVKYFEDVTSLLLGDANTIDALEKKADYKPTNKNTIRFILSAIVFLGLMIVSYALKDMIVTHDNLIYAVSFTGFLILSVMNIISSIRFNLLKKGLIKDYKKYIELAEKENRAKV